jgi:lysophospholipase L1-like esterase
VPAVLLASALLVVAPTTASAAPGTPAPVIYAALGDSFAAGVGTGQDDVAGPPCRRSSLAYPQLWARSRPATSLTFLACSGSSISDVRRQQVSHIPRDATQVTITMGGNDVGFSAVIGVCAIASKDRACTVAVALAKTVGVTEVPVQLGITLRAVRRAAPHARIVVLGYPRLFELGSCPGNVPDVGRRKSINSGADLLDGALSNTSRLFGAHFVDVRARFAGHGVCAPPGQAWINGPDSGTDSYHPNRAGQTNGYLPALSSS